MTNAQIGRLAQQLLWHLREHPAGISLDGLIAIMREQDYGISGAQVQVALLSEIGRGARFTIDNRVALA